MSNKRRKGIYEIDDSRLIIPVNYSKDTIDKVSVVYGTHTHIQTADEKIINSGEGFISDIGMCGPVNSGIGYDLDFEVKRYKEELEDDSKLSNDTNCIFSACMFEIDNNTGKTLTIKRILM